MQHRNFAKCLRLFDYFKQAYRLNCAHKELYKPQIILIVLRGFLLYLVALSFIGIYDNMALLPELATSKFFTIFWNEFKGIPMIITSLMILVLIFGSTYVEGGLYHLYYSSLKNNGDEDTFFIGANRNFLRFLAGNILIGLFWLIAFIPYLLVGLLTLTIGLSLIPIIVNVFLMVWKVAIVSENISIWAALNKSIRFGKANFIPAAILLILKNSITSLSGGGSFNPSFNGGTGSLDSLTTQNTIESPLTYIPNYSGPIDSIQEFNFLPILKLIFTITASLITLIIIITGLIQMIFNIFFGLVFTLIYVDQWTITEEVKQ